MKWEQITNMQKYQNSKSVKIIILTLMIVFSLYGVIQVRNDSVIKEVNLSKCRVYDSSDDYNFHIDKVSFRDDGIKNTKEQLMISGFLTKTGESVSTASIFIVLRNCTDGKYYRVPTMMNQRADVTEAYADGNNYDACGFSIRIPREGIINPEHNDYEIMAIYTLNGKKRVISSGTTIQTWTM